ncbi:restriction endonuclease subunit S [Mycoplasmopsis cynos]|nr:restriction endonuclease subunit S [Mycoplasmopsis cynos]WAM10356.1 restriction endonuclease subunit S [Mycoplasmopsis cynos]
MTWTTDGYAGEVNYRGEKFYCTNVCGVLLNENGFINLCNALSIGRVTKKHVVKVANPKLMNNVMKEILFSYSNNLKEQTNISIIFNNINSLITLHQRELKILKSFKKSLFQKMIVGKKLTILPATLTKMTNVWEQEKIGNIFTITRGYVLGKEKMSLQKMLILNIQCSHHKQKAMRLNGYYNSYLFDKAITWTTDGMLEKLIIEAKSSTALMFVVFYWMKMVL